MRRLVMIAALALAACGNDSVGDRDGACDPADGFAVGDYRCNDNTVQLCTAPDTWSEWPMWAVLESCSWPEAGSGGGACLVGADGIATCIRNQ